MADTSTELTLGERILRELSTLTDKVSALDARVSGLEFLVGTPRADEFDEGDDDEGGGIPRELEPEPIVTPPPVGEPPAPVGPAVVKEN